jgi:hypothetical protein
MKLVVSLLLVICLSAQAEPMAQYEWEKDRKFTALSDAERVMGELIVKQHQQYDYALINGEFFMFSAYHRIVYVNTSEAVQKHNRISISMYNTMELVELKARVINAAGKVTNFDKSNLKELKDEESGDAFRIFAMEGVEIGSEVEYYFVKKMSGAIYNRINLQSDTRIKSASCFVSVPNHLKLDFKSYNGASEIKRKETTADDSLNIYSLQMIDVPALKEESYSYFAASLSRVEYKLAYNLAKTKARLYTWEEAGKVFYRILYGREKEDDKALEKYIKTFSVKSSATLPERIAAVEEKIKKEVKVEQNQRSPQLGSIANIIKMKVASSEGITKLFLAVYEQLGIACVPAITTDRKNTRFDGAFDSWSFLDNYIIYFPETKGFIAPYEFGSRYPLIPATWAAQQGLFIEPITVGELKSGLATVEDIPATDYQISKDNLVITATISDNLKDCEMKVKREFTGHDASFILPYIDFMNDEQRKTMVEELTKQTAPDARLKSWTVNAEPNKGLPKIGFDVNYQTSHFLEKAGPRILFKAGLLIGPQVEMYRDDARQNPVENDFNRAYERDITIIIPDGYTIKNPDDLKIKVLYEDGQRIPFSFESTYTLSGNKLTLTVTEYYKEIYAPLNRYEDFRKVINASADFNKVTLVLEKK